MYITKEIHACIMYVSYIQLFYAITKKIIHHSNQGWRLEIKGENVRKHIFVSAIILCTIRQFFFGRLHWIAWPLTFIWSACGFMYEICQKIVPS